MEWYIFNLSRTLLDYNMLFIELKWYIIVCNLRYLSTGKKFTMHFCVYDRRSKTDDTGNWLQGNLMHLCCLNNDEISRLKNSNRKVVCKHILHCFQFALLVNVKKKNPFLKIFSILWLDLFCDTKSLAIDIFRKLRNEM